MPWGHCCAPLGMMGGVAVCGVRVGGGGGGGGGGRQAAPLHGSGSGSGSAVEEGAAAAAGIAVLAMRRDHKDKTLCARWHPTAPALITSAADKRVLLYAW